MTIPQENHDLHKNHAAFIWSVADLLRGDYKQSEYGKVILPLTVIRRLDCVLEPHKPKILELHNKYSKAEFAPIITTTIGEQFFNTSKLTLPKLLDDPNHIADNLRAYIAAFSPEASDVIDKFDFGVQITRLDKSDLLYQVIGRFCAIDLHPDKVSNVEMGYLYEELIRRFSELSNEIAGEHFTPREVIDLMVDLLFIEDDDLLRKPGIVKTLFDPACGTGGMLSVAHNHPCLLEIPGVAALTAAKLVGEIAGIERFSSDSKLAVYAGVAPLQASSGNRQRHRLSRRGNRQLNAAFHRIAVTQIRCHEPARDYAQRKMSEGKTKREAIRCLKRQLVRVVFTTLRSEAMTSTETAPVLQPVAA